jgi:hypothetical protein
MKNTSTGFGLALLAGAIVTHTLVSNFASTANASAVTSAASAVSTAVAGQTGPTIVWYGIAHSPLNASGAGITYGYTVIARAWSDGKVEMKKVCSGNSCADQITDLAGWYVVSDPAQGLTYRSDINFDEQVDGADLGQLLADWGNAPRQDIPPSDCPLALINP